MTMGIYALVWDNSYDSIYIGQSINIGYRYRQHLELLNSNRHYNYKVINATSEYGNPSLHILEEVSVSSLLDSREIYWINEFDSINKGMNIASGGIAGRGLNHSNSKHSKFTLLKIFSLLYKSTIPYVDIATRCNVNKSVVHNIALGTHHLWLRDAYPDKFSTMLANKLIRSKTNLKTYASEGKTHKPLMSPDGEVFESIPNIAEFCRTHPLLKLDGDSARSSIAKVLKGTKSSHKGWHLA